jgi:hypothetical protein
VVLEQDTTQPEETLLAQTVKVAVIHLRAIRNIGS